MKFNKKLMFHLDQKCQTSMSEKNYKNGTDVSQSENQRDSKLREKEFIEK